MKTMDILDYNQARLEVVQHQVVFRVAACSDVHVALSLDTSFDSTTTYEVIIGGWTNTK